MTDYSVNEATGLTLADKHVTRIDSGEPSNHPLLQPFMDQPRGAAAGSDTSYTSNGREGDPLLRKDIPAYGPISAADQGRLDKESVRIPHSVTDDYFRSEHSEFMHKFEEIPYQTVPEKIEDVRTKLENGVNELIPPADRALLKQLRDGALDANPEAIQAAYKSLEGDPQKLHAMVKELNSEFAGLESLVRLGVTDDNRLIMSADGKNGMVVSDKGVDAAKVTKAADGYVHLSQEPGLSSSVSDVAAAVRNDLGREHEFFAFSHEFYKTPGFHKEPNPNVIWDELGKINNDGKRDVIGK